MIEPGVVAIYDSVGALLCSLNDALVFQNTE